MTVAFVRYQTNKQRELKKCPCLFADGIFLLPFNQGSIESTFCRDCYLQIALSHLQSYFQIHLNQTRSSVIFNIIIVCLLIIPPDFRLRECTRLASLGNSSAFDGRLGICCVRKIQNYSEFLQSSFISPVCAKCQSTLGFRNYRHLFFLCRHLNVLFRKLSCRY